MALLYVHTLHYTLVQSSTDPAAREFDTGTNRLKGNGGSTAVGHPLRSTGYRMLTDLLNELERSGSRHSLLTICEGGDMANATIIERIS